MRNIWETTAEGIIVPSNGVGAYGAGLALQAHQRYPETTLPYQTACRLGRQAPGELFRCHTSDLRHVLIFLPTKRHWRDRSRLDDVALGIIALANLMRHELTLTVAMPPIGCGLGGLRWSDVLPLLATHLPMDRVDLYPPGR